MSPGGDGVKREGRRHISTAKKVPRSLEQHCFTPCVPYIARERRTGELLAAPQVEDGQVHALQHRDVTCHVWGSEVRGLSF